MQAGWQCTHPAANQYRTNGHPAGQRFGDAQQVRLHSRMLAGKDAPRAANASLHFINYQKRAVFAAQALRRQKILRISRADAAFALNYFQNYCGGLAGEGSGERVNIVVGYMCDASQQRLKGLAIFVLAGEAQRTHCAAVKTALGTDHRRPAGARTRKLVRCFHRFCA